MGAGSLRQAIENVNSDSHDTQSSPDTITFAIPASDLPPNSNTWIISLNSSLPPITNPVILNGTTQPGYSSVPVIEIDGSNLVSENGQPIYGLELSSNTTANSSSAGSTIKGLDIVNFAGPGIDIETDSNSIQDNYVGVETDGRTAAPNIEGVLINGSNNTIGASSGGAGNVIASNVIANNTTAVDVNSGDGNEIQGNLIYDNSHNIILSNNNLYPSPTLALSPEPTSNSGVISVWLSVSTSEVGSSLTLDFYTDALDQEPARFYLGSVLVTPASSSPFEVTLSGSVANGQSIIATATEPEVNQPIGTPPATGTSMFSNSVLIMITSNFSVTNTSDSGAGSLEQTIINVDSEPPSRGTTDVITFNIPTTDPGFNSTTGIWRISQTAQLSMITEPVTIDGLSQIPGFSTSPVIEIYGGGGDFDGLNLGPGSTGSTITGLDIVDFGGAGIHIESSDDTITDNLIGTDGNAADSTLGDRVGIFVDGADGGGAATIGGTTSSSANTIGFNNAAGVSISGSLATGNVVAGNFIGTNSNGQDLGNSEGVVIDDAPGNTIGGTGSPAANGTVSPAANVIDFNTTAGVLISGASATGNVVAGNWIGTDSDNRMLGNSEGVVIDNAPGNMIGGTAPSSANLIDFNTTVAVSISGMSTTGNVVAGNLIGTNGEGVDVDGDASNNTIGGTVQGAGNTISGSTGAAVVIASGSGNAIRQNLIYGNKSAIVVDAGANNNQAAPGMVAVASVPNLTTIDYSVIGTVGQSYSVDFFASSSLGSPAAQYLGTTTVTLTSATQTFTAILTTITSPNSLANLLVPSSWFGTVPADSPIGGGLQSTQSVTATVTGPANNTSQFAATAVIPASPFVVTNTTDYQAGSDVGSLRQAIVDSNTDPATPITFDIEGTSPFVIRVSPQSSLPQITEPVKIDGTSQAGPGGVPLIELNGGNGKFDGLDLEPGSDGSTIEGLTIEDFDGEGILVNSANNTIGGRNQVGAGGTVTRTDGNVISGNTKDGILIDSAAAIDNIVEGNFIGTNVTATAAVPNDGAGVEIMEGSATVGGTVTAAGNVISGNMSDGILIESTGTLVAANLIGTDVTGTTSLPNQGDGVDIGGGASNIMIGGTSPATRNIISGNTMNGILIDSAATNTNIVVQGNYIGTNAAGTGSVSNDGNGIEVSMGSATIGGTVTADPNVISGNWLDGILIDTPDNMVLGNFVGTNASGTGPLPNDTANNNQPNSGGVVVLGVTGNTIGGPNQVNADGSVTRTAGNVISGNSASGICISNAGNPGNTVIGNYIGTDLNGDDAIGNVVGITISSASGNLIGNATAGAGNLISGNIDDGINIGSSGTTGNLVAGNQIGTNAAGTAAIANGNDGVEIENSATGNIIGGTTAMARNTISGNTAAGVEIDTAAPRNVVEGNFIGTNPAGELAVGNNIGIMISSASYNTIGGTSGADRNLISGNNSIGIQIANGDATGNLVTGNWIGTTEQGSGVVLKPSLSTGSPVGVLIDDAPANTIGGSVFSGDGNLISGFAFGIEIIDFGAHNNLIEGNSIGTDQYGNVEIDSVGIGVYLDGVSQNTVGGSTAAGLGNEILGYSDYGVYIYGTLATDNVIQGDQIGPPDDHRRLAGIAIQDASSNTIGGLTSADGNTISGNAYASVYIFGHGTSASNNFIDKNRFVDNGYGILLYNATNNGGYSQLLSRNRFVRDHIANVRVFVGSVTSTGTSTHPARSKSHHAKQSHRAVRTPSRQHHDVAVQHPPLRLADQSGSKADHQRPRRSHELAFAIIKHPRQAVRARAVPSAAVPHGPMAHMASPRLINHPPSAKAHAGHATGRSGS